MKWKKLEKNVYNLKPVKKQEKMSKWKIFADSRKETISQKSPE
mgnify:CR=1 FL=1